MIYVHVPGIADTAAERILDVAAPFASLQAFIVESFGRASAALLSLLSGWLCALKLTGGSISSMAPRADKAVDAAAALGMIMSRVRSTIVPMVFWALLTMVVYAVVTLFRPTFLLLEGETLAVTFWRYLNTILFLTEAPHGPTLHLSFLRDLFVCFLLAPVLIAVLKRHAVPLVVAIGIVYIADGTSVIILRPLILFAFTLGLWGALRGVSPTALDGTTGWWLALACLSTLGVLIANAGHLDALDRLLETVGLDLRESVLYPLARLFVSLSVWCVSAHIVRQPAGQLLRRQMPWLFATFCSHFLVLSVLYHGAWLPLAGSAGTGPVFFLWFLCAPVISLIVAYTAVRLVHQWLPELSPIMGSRLGGGGGGSGGTGVPTVALPASSASAAQSVRAVAGGLVKGAGIRAPVAPVSARGSVPGPGASATSSSRDRVASRRDPEKAPV